jgi:hypothetical protein
MLQASLLEFDSEGRVILSLIGEVAEFNGGTPVDNEGRLVVTTTEPTAKGWADGMTYDAVTGALWVTETGTITHYISGNPMVGEAMKIDSAGYPKSWIAGVPLSDGVCVNGPPGTNVNLNFLAGLPSSVTFTRTSVGTYFNQSGLMASAALNVPRFEFAPLTGNLLGLLMEDQRTNLMRYSNKFDQDDPWFTNVVAVTPNSGTGLMGANDAWLLANSTTTDDIPTVYQPFASTAAAYTQSIYAKAGTAHFLGLGLYDGSGVKFCGFNLLTGAQDFADAGVTTSIQDVGNGWYRCSLHYTYPAVTGRMYVSVYHTTNAKSYTPTGVGVDNILIWGAQIEEGTFASSYIPTVATTIVRISDTAAYDFTGKSGVAGGTLFAQYSMYGIKGGQYAAQIIEPIGNTQVLIYASGGAPAMVLAVSGVTQAVIVGGTLVTANNTIKRAGAYALNDVVSYTNSGQDGTDNVALLPTAMTDLNIGVQLNGHVQRVTYWPSRLTNAQLDALTT